MTKQDQLQLVIDLISSIQSEIISNVPAMPDEWDGHELRRYIADKFEERTGGMLQRGNVRISGASKRLAAYRNEVIIRNL